VLPFMLPDQVYEIQTICLMGFYANVEYGDICIRLS
jgi:hypothetical protein